jgi:hypothetical protein
MIKKIYRSAKMRLLASSRLNFLGNQDGIAAIEFAFIAPIMLFMYFGMAEVATAISIDRKISHSTNVAGDLSTQSERVSANDMSEFMTATMLVMGVPPEKQDAVTIEIASYARAEDNSIIEKGIAVLKGGEKAIDLPKFEAKDLDQRILSSSSGVVVARVNYVYEPLQLRYMPSKFNISETFMLKPRKSANVDIEELANDGSLQSNKYKCDFAEGNKVTCSANGTLDQSNNQS